jgi:HAD superfamily hydrolase (TIGR01509 family)
VFDAVIFDADGTLLDSLWIWNSITVNLLKAKGIVPPVDINAILAEKSVEEGIIYLLDRFKLDETKQSMQVWYDKTLQQWYGEKVKLLPHAEEVLAFLKDRQIEIFVASATDRPLLEACFSNNGILPLLSGIVSEKEIGIPKREPAFYSETARRLHLDRTGSLVVEDAVHAATSAMKAGFATVHIGTGKLDGVPYNITDLRELEAIV